MTDLEIIKDIVINNKIIDSKSILSIVIPILKRIPVPITTVKHDSCIERAVEVGENEYPLTIDRLSYIPLHLKNIAKQNRFNKDNESMFYGAFTDLSKPEITRYYLACEIKQDLFNINSLEMEFIVSKWYSIKPFDAVLFIFDEKYCQNSLLKDAYQSYQNDSIYQSLSNDEKEILKLITVELAKPNPINGYTISNAIFDFYKSKGYKAIVYPGVQSKFRGNNIAILPDQFNKSYNFFLAVKFKLVKEDKDIEINDVEGFEIKDGELRQFSFGDDERGETQLFSV